MLGLSPRTKRDAAGNGCLIHVSVVGALLLKVLQGLMVVDERFFFPYLFHVNRSKLASRVLAFPSNLLQRPFACGRTKGLPSSKAPQTKKNEKLLRVGVSLKQAFSPLAIIIRLFQIASYGM